MPTKTAVIIVAAGKGKRFGSKIPKQFLLLNNLPILTYSLKMFMNHPEIQVIQTVINSEHSPFYQKSMKTIEKLKNFKKILPPCFGGKERTLSVKSGLIALSNLKHTPEQVLIHDAARPLVSKKIIDAVLNNLATFEAVFPALPMVDTVWQVKKNVYQLIKDRHLLIRAQTPQGFKFSSIFKAHQENDEFWAYDDIFLANKFGMPIRQVLGCENNLKITNDEDLIRAERLIT